MKKAEINRFGGYEVVELVEDSFPTPGEKEVVVKVSYAGVNPLDWKVRSGMMKMVTGSKFPMGLGSEASGVVSEVGNKVDSLKSGDRVVLTTGLKGGAYSEFVKVSEANCCKIPSAVSLKDAAGSYICGITALQCLTEKGKVGEGSQVLLIGASGGVGSFAVQIANLLGAEVTGVCSTPNVDYVKSLGAQKVVDYTVENPTELKERFDLVFDAVNAHSWKTIKPLLKPKGIYVNTMPDPVMFLRQALTSVFSSKKCKTYILRPDREQMSWLLDKMDSGEIRVTISKTFPLEQVANAISENEIGRTRGKIIVEIDPSSN